MNLSEKQKQVMTATENKILVNAAAGSGKTKTLIARIQYLLSQGISPKEIVAITFTNAAADEINERLGSPVGLFVGTIHSYANYLLRASGHDTSQILDDEKFNKLFKEVKKYPDCVKSVDFLLLDEAQDSTPQQFEFIINMIAPKNYMFFFDVRQSIYRWAGAYPDYLIGLMERPEVTTYDLNENYRNGKEILRFAKSIITLAGYSYKDYSIAMRDTNGRVIEVEYSPNAIARTLAEYEGNYNDWFIITRTNSEIEEMCEYLNKYGIPYTTFKKAGLSAKELKERMSSNTVKVLTIHTSKGLEAKNVVVIGARFSTLEDKCISYVAATRAKDLLVWTHKVRRRTAGVENWE